MNQKVEKNRGTREAHLLHELGRLEAELKKRQIELLSLLLFIVFATALPLYVVLKSQEELLTLLRSDPMRAEMENKDDRVHGQLVRVESGVLEARRLSAYPRPRGDEYVSLAPSITLDSYASSCSISVHWFDVQSSSESNSIRATNVSAGSNSCHLSLRTFGDLPCEQSLHPGLGEISIESEVPGWTYKALVESDSSWEKGEKVPNLGRMAVERTVRKPKLRTTGLELIGGIEGALRVDTGDETKRLVSIP